jgi:hypothetical protein
VIPWLIVSTSEFVRLRIGADGGGITGVCSDERFTQSEKEIHIIKEDTKKHDGYDRLKFSCTNKRTLMI